MSVASERRPTEEAAGQEALRALLAEAGVAGRRLRVVVALLTEAPHTMASLIQQSAVEHRTVEHILGALRGDLDTTDDGRVRIASRHVTAYRRLIDYQRLRASSPADPLSHLMERHGALVGTIRRSMDEMPGGRRALDQVSATPETTVRRAVWLESTFDLDGARLLCVGDHDLTSLAAIAVNPRVEVTVVDVDDRILEFIDGASGGRVRCLWSDFRFGLPAGAREWADLIFTDPPYTPEGVGLFLTRGVEGLRDRANARLMLAYGFGANQTGLGLKVQQALADLNLVYDAVLPAFNRYHGAQAVGSSSNLYVLRPTSRTWTSAGRPSLNIYTHGAQSLEADQATLAASELSTLRGAAAGPDKLDVMTVGEKGWPLAAVFTGERTGDRRALALDLGSDPGSWLFRVLLVLDAPRIAVLVPNNQPDLANEAAQRALTQQFTSKWRIRLRKSTPSPRWAIVEADRVDVADLDLAGQAVRAVLDKAHGKVRNTWREALIRARDGKLTKNEARALIHNEAAGHIDEQLISLPRHRIATLRDGIARSVSAPD